MTTTIVDFHSDGMLWKCKEAERRGSKYGVKMSSHSQRHVFMTRLAPGAFHGLEAQMAACNSALDTSRVSVP